MLMAILKRHTSIIQTETKDKKEIDTKEKEVNCIQNIKNIEIKQPLPNGCDATLETIQIRDGALKLKKLKVSKLCTILVVIIVKIIFIRSFLF